MESLLFISDISKKTGLSIHTLRYYEQIGLLKNIHRNQSGRRVHTKLDLEWLEWVKRLKSTGMPLEKMQDFAQFRLQGEQTLKQRQALLIAHSAQLKQEIKRLKQEQSIVDYKIEIYAQKMLELE
jgi:DNA-binding transcriptional MerR regulator